MQRGLIEFRRWIGLGLVAGLVALAPQGEVGRLAAADVTGLGPVDAPGLAAAELTGLASVDAHGLAAAELTGHTPAGNTAPVATDLHAPAVTEHARGAKIAPAVSALISTGTAEPIDVLFYLRPASATPSSPTLALKSPTQYVQHMKASFAAAADQPVAALRTFEADGKVTDLTPLWIANVVAATVTPEVVLEMAHRSDIRLITVDGTAPMDDWHPVATSQVLADDESAADPIWNIELIRADDVWNLLGYDGQGVTVAVLDTGVDYHHPLLQERYRGHTTAGAQNKGNWWCSPDDQLCGIGPKYPVDGVGHGTHVAGTILGMEGIGVAPGANWIAARVCPTELCRDSWIIAGMQWLLEPDGRADLMPDVVNGSFATTSQNDLAFKDSVDALVGAGIAAVMASGNNPDLVGAPGSYPESITVGALTDQGTVWYRSGRGMSLRQEIKPELVAPGVAITSSVPGGGMALSTGTSMATPHVAGVAALLLQASPDLTPAELKDVLKRTATPLAENLPDPDSGWGIVNAFAAVSAVTDVGHLTGRVLHHDGRPIPWSRVHLAELGGGHLASAETDPATGQYELAARPGVYQLMAEAFAFEPQVERRVEVRQDAETEHDFELRPVEELGSFLGRVYGIRDDARTPISATLTLAEAPEQFVIESNEYTGFAQQLPPGMYSVRVERFGYRVATDSVKIEPGSVVTRTYELDAAPTILLVEGDGWMYSGSLDYYRASLDRIGYLYDEWRVTNEIAGSGKPGGSPTEEELSRYDLVIWSSPTSSPGFVGGANALTAYMKGGGRVLIAGQDALCTDAGTDVAEDPCNLRAGRHAYVQDLLHLRVLRDNSQSFIVHGTEGGPLDGMTLTLNGEGSQGNQKAPDVYAVVDPMSADLIAEYDGGGGAGVLAGTCEAHRGIALGFGLEGVASSDDRDEVVRRLIDALTAPPPDRKVRVHPTEMRQVVKAGATAEYTVTLANIGGEPSSIEAVVDEAKWDTTLWRAGLTEPLTVPLKLGHCDQAMIGIRVTVPEDARHGEVDTARIRLSAVEGGIEESVLLRTGRAAPVLVVDGDYFLDSEERYLMALEAAGIPYDVWEFGLRVLNPDRPEYADLADYPALVWFTGYDWRANGSLSIESQQELAQYLDGGGRLFFASEDYLLYRGGTPYEGDRLFHRDYFGVDEYVIDEGRAHLGALAGAPGSIFEGIEGCRIPRRPPVRDVSDRLEPSAVAKAAILDGLEQPVALQTSQGSFKTVFFAFDLGLVEQTCANAIMERSIDWFSPLTDSQLRDPSGQTTYSSGDTVELEIELLNTGPNDVRNVRAVWHIPDQVELSEAPPGWAYKPDLGELSWRGDMPRGQRLLASATIVLPDEMPVDSTVSSTADIYDGQGITLQRAIEIRVNSSDLRGSRKSVPDDERRLMPGEKASFSISIRNSGTRPAQSVVLTDTLPAGLEIDARSVLASTGEWSVDKSEGILHWTCAVDDGGLASISYDARVTTLGGGWLKNTAVITDEFGERLSFSASVFARPLLFFPSLASEVDEDP